MQGMVPLTVVGERGQWQGAIFTSPTPVSMGEVSNAAVSWAVPTFAEPVLGGQVVDAIGVDPTQGPDRRSHLHAPFGR